MRLLIALLLTSPLAAADRPNVLWIFVDDMSADFACYGGPVETPHVDAMAERGVKFTNCYVTAPVCSPCRSALITGMYQTSIGAHHHRSGRGKLKIELPSEVELVPAMFQDAGYHTSITGWPVTGKKGKTDYNFEWDPSVYDSADWRDRDEGQPFFAQVQLPGGKLRGSDVKSWERIQSRTEKTLGSRTSNDDVELPPYYPAHPDIVRDWAAYLDSVRMTDHVVGEIVARLEEDDVLDETLVCFMTDHGISHARGKQFLYDEGIHVPFVVTGPGIEAGVVREDLVEHIDMAALSLAAAGIGVPEWMQARDILAEGYEPREAVFAARDRCDETVDHIRSVRTQDFKYIRNFLHQRPYLQPNRYKDGKAIIKAIRAEAAAGNLNETQQLVTRDVRPPEELYDLSEDPFEINNLANDPAYANTLVDLRGRLDDWMERTGDLGRTPESEAMYDSDMAVNLQKHKRAGGNERVRILERNIATMKRWAAGGK